jgi:putative Mg2+ transporter-C (MgtC) family protein
MAKQAVAIASGQGQCSPYMLDIYDIGRLLLALILGGAIGFERGWRGHAAGPHTNGLVALGAALFVMLARDLGADSAGRVVSQVATGVGFLAGGVILRDGLRVRGLNTAATVWCVAAIGCFTGLGNLWLALAATLLIVAGNSLLHVLEHRATRFKGAKEQADYEDRSREKRHGTFPSHIQTNRDDKAGK